MRSVLEAIDVLERLRTYPDPILRAVCQPVEATRRGLRDSRDIERELVETLSNSGGAGLAAPQIGYPVRIVAINTPAGSVVVMRNLDLQPVGTETNVSAEGCLSLGSLRVRVRRPKQVTATWIDDSGKEQCELAGLYMSRVLQHELDHLNGVLMVDHLPKSSADRRRASRHLKRMRREAAREAA